MIFTRLFVISGLLLGAAHEQTIIYMYTIDRNLIIALISFFYFIENEERHASFRILVVVIC